MEEELRLRGGEVDAPLDTVFFGGGTPSVLSERTLARLCSAVRDNFRFAGDAEWSVEANPSSLDASKLRILRDHGVGRVSMGVQSFDPRLLRLMGRVHDADGAGRALDLLASSGLRWSADLMFALPGQTVDGFLSDLERLLAWSPAHVSFYGLTWEPGTAFRRALDDGRLAEIPEDDWAAMYQGGVDRLGAEGIARYEVSNFARPGQECRHNQAYWRTDSVWMAVGNAAHGYRPCVRWRNPRGLAEWSAWADDGFPDSGREFETLTPEERWTEEWFLGLRTSGGVAWDRLVHHPFSVPRDRLRRRVAAGHVVEDEAGVRLVGDGWMLLDAIAADLSMTA